MRFSIGRRPTAINLSCARVAMPGGKAALTLSTSEAYGGMAGAGGESQPALSEPPLTPSSVMKPNRKPRCLWALDAEGRFGAIDPLLVEALGPDAPRQGESVEQLCSRVQIEHVEQFATLIGKRETFSGLPLVWPGREGKQRRVILFATPIFDGRREFNGYRGFGFFEEPSDVAGESDDGLDRVSRSECEPPRVGPSSEPKGTKGEFNESSFDWGASSPGATASSENKPTTMKNEADRSESAPAPSECADVELAQPGEPKERTAEIYFLRQSTASPSKVVPIRPGADGPAGRDPQAATESIELTRSERDAFREIARTLVSGPQALRQNEEPEHSASPEDSRDEPDKEPAVRALQAPPAENERPENEETARRNALNLLDRLPVGILVARDARTLYLNRTLLGFLGYRDFAQFESSDGLAIMFGGHDPQSAPFGDDAALTITRADGSSAAVEGLAQVILWNGVPATLFSLRPSSKAEVVNKLGRVDLAAPAPMGSASDLQEMLDLAADGAVILDAAGRILSFNGPAERLFGYLQHEVVGESVLMLLAPQSHAEATGSLDRLSRDEDRQDSEAPLAVIGRTRDGDALTLALTLAKIGPPEAPSYCVLVRDVRREREAEARLAAARDRAIAASAAKTDFLAQVSHEIRTPLHAILGFAEVMMEDRFGPIGNERYRDYLKDIHTSGKHVMSLVDDLLDLSKIEAGRLELEFAPVDANGVIRECVSLMQPEAARERVILRVSLFDRLPRVMVDERSLRQVILNLMSNAVKFTEPGGQVIVSTAVDAAGQAVIRVRDTGMGMNESEVGVALKPFGQVGRGGRKGGVGLGLPLTKALVEANKAEFTIKSRREQGTLVEIAFPSIQAAQ
jgi:PAS domain S-box-containing protein